MGDGGHPVAVADPVPTRRQPLPVFPAGHPVYDLASRTYQGCVRGLALAILMVCSAVPLEGQSYLARRWDRFTDPQPGWILNTRIDWSTRGLNHVGHMAIGSGVYLGSDYRGSLLFSLGWELRDYTIDPSRARLTDTVADFAQRAYVPTVIELWKRDWRLGFGSALGGLLAYIVALPHLQ